LSGAALLLGCATHVAVAFTAGAGLHGGVCCSASEPRALS